MAVRLSDSKWIMNPRTLHELWQGAPDIAGAGTGRTAIEVSIDRPDGTAVGLAVIAHPHPLFGGTKDNKVVQTIARAFLQMGFVTVRPNFRGVGQSAGEHDNGRAETADHLAIARHALQTLMPAGSTRLAMAGFSFGAFVTTHAAAQLATEGVQVEKQVLVGTACSRFDVAPVPANTLVIHGDADDTVPLDSVLQWARPQTLPVMVLPGVEHFFHGKLPLLKELIVRMYPA